VAVNFRLSFYGDVQLNRTLVRLQKAPQSMWPAWENLANRFRRMERKQFATEGAYASGGWPPLSPRYAKWKATAKPGAPILVFSGDLRKSLTERPFGVEVLEHDHMVVGSSIDYGLFHQRGDGVPQRRPVEFPEAERQAWVKVIHQFIRTGRI
jgi:phage gpG-like protein